MYLYNIKACFILRLGGFFFVDVAPVIVISIKDRDSVARLCLLQYCARANHFLQNVNPRHVLERRTHKNIFH